MITAVDTNVLLDLLTRDPEFEPGSKTALKRCADQGRLVVCEVVWAETTSWFHEPDDCARVLASLGVLYDGAGQAAASRAGAAWREYRRHSGRRTRLIADFLVGAHALHQADRLLTRDRGFYRRYFARLSVLDPSA